MLPTTHLSCTLKARVNWKPTKGIGGQPVKPVFIEQTDNAGGVLEPTNWRVCELWRTCQYYPLFAESRDDVTSIVMVTAFTTSWLEEERRCLNPAQSLESVNTESVTQRLKLATGATGVRHSGNVNGWSWAGITGDGTPLELLESEYHLNHWSPTQLKRNSNERVATGTAGDGTPLELLESNIVRIEGHWNNWIVEFRRNQESRRKDYDNPQE